MITKRRYNRKLHNKKRNYRTKRKQSGGKGWGITKMFSKAKKPTISKPVAGTGTVLSGEKTLQSVANKRGSDTKFYEELRATKGTGFLKGRNRLKKWNKMRNEKIKTASPEDLQKIATGQIKMSADPDIARQMRAKARKQIAMKQKEVRDSAVEGLKGSAKKAKLKELELADKAELSALKTAGKSNKNLAKYQGYQNLKKQKADIDKLKDKGYANLTSAERAQIEKYDKDFKKLTRTRSGIRGKLGIGKGAFANAEKLKRKSKVMGKKGESLIEGKEFKNSLRKKQGRFRRTRALLGKDKAERKLIGENKKLRKKFLRGDINEDEYKEQLGKQKMFYENYKANKTKSKEIAKSATLGRFTPKWARSKSKQSALNDLKKSRRNSLKDIQGEGSNTLTKGTELAQKKINSVKESKKFVKDLRKRGTLGRLRTKRGVSGEMIKKQRDARRKFLKGDMSEEEFNKFQQQLEAQKKGLQNYNTIKAAKKSIRKQSRFRFRNKAEKAALKGLEKDKQLMKQQATKGEFDAMAQAKPEERVEGITKNLDKYKKTGTIKSAKAKLTKEEKEIKKLREMGDTEEADRLERFGKAEAEANLKKVEKSRTNAIKDIEKTKPPVPPKPTKPAANTPAKQPVAEAKPSAANTPVKKKPPVAEAKPAAAPASVKPVEASKPPPAANAPVPTAPPLPGNVKSKAKMFEGLGEGSKA